MYSRVDSFGGAQMGHPREAREKGFIVTNMITVMRVRTRSVNGRVFQHRVVSGKYIDDQTSLDGPHKSVWTHLAVLRRDIS